MGDFNAKIGMDNTGYEDIMGTHGLGQMNEKGERFADLCALNQLVIGGSIFPHKRIHKATWISPNHVTENHIDHICISRKFRRSWQDVRVMRVLTVIRPPPSYDNSETSPQEIHHRQQHTDKVQCWIAQRQGHTSSFPDQPFQQVPSRYKS